jgi:hypothetical protein
MAMAQTLLGATDRVGLSFLMENKMLHRADAIEHGPIASSPMVIDRP